jgi:predicted nucleotide-binding protein (sugar kinase/HSP70/actin superfamily)
MRYDTNATKPLETVTVGIPEGLMFFEQKTLWKNFFERLGCRAVCSGRTTRNILNSGINLCCNETCLPVKAFAGHAASLCDKTDYIFIPRCASVCPHEKSCPKFCGLPDEMRISLKGRANIISADIDYNRDPQKTRKSLASLSGRLGIPCKAAELVFNGCVKPGLTADISPNASGSMRLGVPVIAVLGHPYIIFDSLLSMGLIDKLRDAGYCVLTPYDVRRSVRRKYAGRFLSTSFFETGLDIVGGTKALYGLPQLAGMIYISPFSCGVDSVVMELTERIIMRGPRHIPFLKLTVDEHSGEAGFNTRIEAFLDMISGARRKSI